MVEIEPIYAEPGRASEAFRRDDQRSGAMSERNPSSETNQSQDQVRNKDGVQGEGNYDAARKFDRMERAFVENDDVEGKARAAEEALDSPEGEDLERARRETADRGKGMGEA
jgi:hypothetical protein